MHLEFKKINLARDYGFCVASRRDAYVCSFHRDDGFDEFLAGYRERMATRLTSQEWHYLHVWQGGEIVGQLEFCTVSAEPETGYVYLIYLTPQARGQGMADLLCNISAAPCGRLAAGEWCCRSAVSTRGRCVSIGAAGGNIGGQTPSMPRQISMNIGCRILRDQ